MNPFSSLAEYEQFVYTLRQRFPSILHHKHIPPDIKHHRIPAPELGFQHPTFSFSSTR